uniref:Uncharacterized protein n=1 Tax=Emiliania huxleyi TaxID=2903 RepID=A0A7S3RTB4_EMIHU
MPAAAIDAVATVAAGLFYTQSLLPLWLFNLRVNGRWDGLVLIFSTDETAARRAVAESTFSANRTTVVRLTTVSSRRHQPRRQQEYVSLKTRIFDMVPAEFDWVERLLVLDTDIMATRRLRAFLSGVAGGVMEVAWPRSGRCDPRVEVVVPAERPTLQVARWLRGPFALGSPSNAWGDRIATHLNTAVQLQHRRCSARCLARWASASASPFSQEDHPGRGLWQASPHVHSPALPTGACARRSLSALRLPWGLVDPLPTRRRRQRRVLAPPLRSARGARRVVSHRPRSRASSIHGAARRSTGPLRRRGCPAGVGRSRLRPRQRSVGGRCARRCHLCLLRRDEAPPHNSYLWRGITLGE